MKQKPWWRRRSTWNTVMAGLVVSGVAPAALVVMAGPLIADAIVETGRSKQKHKPKRDGSSFLEAILRKKK